MNETVWSSIPQGNTQKGVNRHILQKFVRSGETPTKLVDIPCGQGDFIEGLSMVLPKCEVIGYDAFATPLEKHRDKVLTKKVADWTPENEAYDTVTCISGVMVFDGLSELFQKSHITLKPNGQFIITNDNILTMRDRLSFLFFGRLKRFQKIYRPSEGNWNVVLIQALWKHGISRGFRLDSVDYVCTKAEDWMFLPLAILIYPFEYLSLILLKSEVPLKTRLQLFPFKSLLSRHYIMYFRKVNLKNNAWVLFFQSSFATLFC